MLEAKVTQNRLSPDFKSPKAGIYDTDFFISLHSKRKCLAISRFFGSLWLNGRLSVKVLNGRQSHILGKSKDSS